MVASGGQDAGRGLPETQAPAESPVGGVPRGKELRTGCGSGGSGARWRPVSRVRRGWRTAWTSMRAPAGPGCPTTCGHGWTRRRRQGAEALTSGLWRPSRHGRTRRRRWLRMGKGQRKTRRRRKWRTKRRTGPVSRRRLSCMRTTLGPTSTPAWTWTRPTRRCGPCPLTCRPPPPGEL